MGFQGKSIQCSDCGATFTFSADEQELLKQCQAKTALEVVHILVADDR